MQRPARRRGVFRPARRDGLGPGVEAESLGAVDVVITMGCGDSCPVLPGRRYEEWALPDPAGQSLEAIRPIRDEIEQRVRRLLDRLGVSAEPGE